MSELQNYLRYQAEFEAENNPRPKELLQNQERKLIKNKEESSQSKRYLALCLLISQILSSTMDCATTRSAQCENNIENCAHAEEDENAFPQKGTLFDKPTDGTLRNEKISGGFSFDLKLHTAFGMGLETTDSNDIEELFRNFSGQISDNEKLRAAAKTVLRDKFVFEAFKTFLEQGGRLNAWLGGGKYDDNSDPDVGLVINVGIEENVPRVFYHELLHYIFDKTDSAFSESPDSGGADHTIINILEDRFKIMEIIKQGGLTDVPEENLPDPYRLARDWHLKDEINNLLQTNNLPELIKNFYRKTASFKPIADEHLKF